MDNSLKTKKEVAAMLGIDRKTLYIEEKSVGLTGSRKRLNPFEVQRLIDLRHLSKQAFKEKYGIPPNTPS
jgi:hypothetical protein